MRFEIKCILVHVDFNALQRYNGVYAMISESWMRVISRLEGINRNNEHI